MGEFSDLDKSRFQYIEGRPELFSTKLFRLGTSQQENTEENRSTLLAVTRDPGSANAIAPVLEYLQQHDKLAMFALTDGRAQEILNHKFTTEDVTPESFLGTDRIIGRPDVILTDASSEQGIETYSAATFDDVPAILIEDYYASSHVYLQSLLERNLRLPEKICVMDEAAKQMLVKQIPELAERVVVTGQPAFDRFATENTAEIGQDVRRQLGFTPETKLIAYMSTGTDRAELKAMAESLAATEGELVLAFRKHPRDNTSYEEYASMFKETGVKIVDVQEFTTDQVSAAADVILTSWSTEGLHGIYRQKPTIHIVDQRFVEVPNTLKWPFPPVELGASLGVENIDRLSEVILPLLDENSPERLLLVAKMKQYYPADGKNSERVAKIVEKLLASSPAK